MTPEIQNELPMTSDPALASASGSDAAECQNCLATPCMCAAVPTIKKMLRSGQCQRQCCPSPLGELVKVENTTRIICTQCLGFMARWLIELEHQNDKPTPLEADNV